MPCFARCWVLKHNQRLWQLRDPCKGLEKLALDERVLEGRNEWWEAVLKMDVLIVNVWSIVSK